jgi:hypothetical protein
VAAPLRNLSPQALVDEVVATSAADLAHRYDHTLFLLVELGEEVEGLLEPLELLSRKPATFRKRAGADSQATLQVPVFSNVDGAGDADRTELLARLEGSRWFVLPLQKRSGVGDVDEITVGRSDDNDVVLHEGSVSKYHAHFDAHEDGSVALVDGGSKNGTRINGQLLEPGVERWVQPMDHIQFGKVTTFTCVPAVLRSVLRARP